MARKAESSLVNRIRLILIRELPAGSWVRKLADRYTSGLPDLLAITWSIPKNPHFRSHLVVVAFEVKIDNRSQSRIQVVEEEIINGIGSGLSKSRGQCEYFVVRSVNDVREALKSLDLTR